MFDFGGVGDFGWWLLCLIGNFGWWLLDWVCVVQVVVGVCGFRRFWSGAGFVCLVCGLGWIGLFGLRVDALLFLWVS